MSKVIDAADIRILSVLQDDATLSVNEVAERIHLSPNACWRRLRRLEADGIIQKRVALVDPAALGLHVSAYVRLRLLDHTPQTVAKFVESISRIDQVTEISSMSTESVLLLRTFSSTLSAHESLLAKITGQFQVVSLHSDLVLKTYYSTTVMPTD